MKNKVINTAICDVRGVTEDSLKGFDSITVNTAVLITGDRSEALLSRYRTALNAAIVLNAPDEVSVRMINGKHEIGPGTDGAGDLLIINGNLTILNGSRKAVERFFRIMVNGKTLMPESDRGVFRNLTVNGEIEYYPDGASILQRGTEIDDLFLLRASGPVYYCPGELFLTDAALDVGKVEEKRLRFAAKRILVAESLLNRLIPRIDESSEIIRVPDGTRVIRNDLDLKPDMIMRYGTKLCVYDGDVTVNDAEALASLEYLYTNGTVTVSRDLAEAFGRIGCGYEEMRITVPGACYLWDRAEVLIGASVLDRYPAGIYVSDCARVVLSRDLSRDDILDRLHISDCALVVCAKEQEEPVRFIAEDVPMIRVQGEEQAEVTEGDTDADPKDAVVINAAQYVM